MSKKYFSFILAVVFFCTTSGAATLVVAQEKRDAQAEQHVEKIKQKVLKRGTGEKARARVKLADGTKLKGYISEAAADDFTLVRTDERVGTPVRVSYRDVAEFKAQGKGLSTASKILIGVGIGVVATVGILVLAFKDGGGPIFR
jgi:hypothetical protein